MLSTAFKDGNDEALGGWLTLKLRRCAHLLRGYGNPCKKKVQARTEQPARHCRLQCSVVDTCLKPLYQPFELRRHKV